MTVLTKDLIDALYDAIRDEQLHDRSPWKVGVSPDDKIVTDQQEEDVLTIFGLPVRVDERVPAGTVALVSQPGPVVRQIGGAR